MTTMNKQWHLVSRPTGEPTPESGEAWAPPAITLKTLALFT